MTPDANHRGTNQQRDRSSEARRREQAMRKRAQQRRRRIVLGAVIVVAAGIVTAAAWPKSSPAGTPHPSTSSTPKGTSTSPSASSGQIPSIEAGLEQWQTKAPVSREVVLAGVTNIDVLGGLDAAGNSLRQASRMNVATGAALPLPSLAAAIHDGSGAALGTSDIVFGGGSPNTVADVQSIPQAGTGAGTRLGALPAPRSDSATVTMQSDATGQTAPTAFIIGGYTGSKFLPDVLATADGTHFTTVATLTVPVRYPAVAAINGHIYAFGGQIAATGSAVAATDVIQEIDPGSHQSTIVGHLSQPMYGAAAFALGSSIYVAGGQIPNGRTLTEISAFVPSSNTLLNAGLLPQAVAFGGYTTVGTGPSAIGYIVGGEVASQSGPTQAGVASGTLSTVISLRPSTYASAAGTPGAGSPFQGTLLMADRGNNQLVAINASRQITWKYPSIGKKAPPGGFYFPDDSFFIHGGTGIISNQEDNHTIVQIGYPSGKILWQFGHPGVAGGSNGFLNQPDDAYLLKSGVVTVADASNNRILFMSASGKVLGQIGDGKDAHVPGKSIAYPNGDTPLPNGNILVSEIHGSWVDEYTMSGKMVWSAHMTSVNYPSDPQQLGPDQYLMTDYNPPGLGSVLEFTREGTTTWRFEPKAGDAAMKKPSLAERLPSGMIMVNDDYRDRIIVIDPTTNSIVWQYGLTDTPGTSVGKLSIPDGFDLLLADNSTPTHPQTG
jgi:hypothetical protein